jgi:hypothetical protein
MLLNFQPKHILKVLFDSHWSDLAKFILLDKWISCSLRLFNNYFLFEVIIVVHREALRNKQIEESSEIDRVLYLFRKCNNNGFDYSLKLMYPNGIRNGTYSPNMLYTLLGNFLDTDYIYSKFFILLEHNADPNECFCILRDVFGTKLDIDTDELREIVAVMKSDSKAYLRRQDSKILPLNYILSKYVKKYNRLQTLKLSISRRAKIARNLNRYECMIILLLQYGADPLNTSSEPSHYHANGINCSEISVNTPIYKIIHEYRQLTDLSDDMIYNNLLLIIKRGYHVLFEKYSSRLTRDQLVGFKDANGDTLLHHAVRETNTYKIIQYLFDQGTHMETLNTIGKTPLQLMSNHLTPDSNIDNNYNIQLYVSKINIISLKTLYSNKHSLLSTIPKDIINAIIPYFRPDR